MVSRRDFLTGCVGAGAAFLAPPAVAVAADARRKINIAGRQRMLTQRMSKAVLFAHLGIERDRHLEQAAASHALFEDSLRGLRYGDPELELTRETREKVSDGLGRVNGLWLDFGPAVQAAIDSKGTDKAALDQVVALNLGVLKEMNKTVGLTEQAYGGDEIPLHLAIAINIAGRQRMLTQKMSKETAMIAAGYDPDGTRGSLGATVQLFDASLGALRSGMAAVGIQAPKTEAVSGQLAIVSEMWSDTRPAFDAVISEGAAHGDRLNTVATANDPLLKEMNKAVFAYEAEA